MRPLLRVLFALFVTAPACLGAAGAARAQAFLRALRSADSTAEERRDAWDALREGDKPAPKSVVSAIDGQRRKAWKRLKSLMASYPVKRVAARLRRRVGPHRAAARAAVNAKSFSRETLDAAMAPIQQALDDAVDAMTEARGYERILALINELESYAADAGLRFGWDDELGDVLCTLRLVASYVGSKLSQQVVAHNLRVGATIDPHEHACVARLNVHRMLLGLNPVEIDLRLVMAAKKHSEEMAAKDYFSHTSPTSALESPQKRASREQADCRGECIANGPRSGIDAFRGWYYSQGHHKLLIARTLTVGVGRHERLWTLMAGMSRLRGATAAKVTQYVKQRYRAGDDTEHLYKLARWCSSVRMKTQAIDELERIVALEPDNEQATKALASLRGKER